MRYCANCFETVETKGFCKVCRMPICKNRFGWIHDLTQTLLENNPKGEGIHSATPGGKSPKKKGKVAAWIL